MADAPEPCRLCGAPVRIRQMRMPDGALSDTGPRFEPVRVCSSPTCPSRQRERSLADEP